MCQNDFTLFMEQNFNTNWQKNKGKDLYLNLSMKNPNYNTHIGIHVI